MRAELLYNPFLLFERLGQWAVQKQRLQKLKKTVASNLTSGHIDSLELLELLKTSQIKVIYDIGANVGTWTVFAKAIFPNAQIHSFEPLPVHIEKFKQTTSQLKDVSLHQIGLGSSSTQLKMKVTDFSDASSLLPLTDKGKKTWSLEQVDEVPLQIERLEDWVTKHSLPNPDLIKLDVQGYELEVLRGSGICLKAARWILVEVSFQEFYQGQPRFDQIVTFLAEAGFYLQAIGHGTLLGKYLVQADVLFVRMC